MTHVLVKLSNREDIVGVLDSDKNDILIIRDPMILVIKHDSNDETGAILLNYIPFSSKNYITVYKQNVVSIIELSEDMIKYYFVSRLYSYKTFDKNFSINLRKSTHYLENYLSKNNKDMKIYMSQPTSNTVN
tara:strand:+ start:269 stop:664 length:396 start_codon:yes stop_codon:yes gene_type:complete